MKTIRKLKWMLVVVLLGWANVSNAHVYWNPNVSTDGNGASPSTPCRHWSTAKSKLAAQGNDQYIIMMAKWILNADLTIDGTISGKDNARVIRYTGFKGYMFSTSQYELRFCHRVLAYHATGVYGFAAKGDVAQS